MTFGSPCSTKKTLYSTDNMLMRKYLNDAPFTTPISQESPGRLGTWVGWQIIQSYMNKNKNVTLQQLMNETNYQKIECVGVWELNIYLKDLKN
jgi:hypothetical protein